MELSDEVNNIYLKYVDSRNRIIPKKVTHITGEEIECLRKYLVNLPISYTPVTLLQHIKNKVYEIGKCKRCGKPTKWLKNHYQEYCCLLCMQKSIYVKENRIKTNLHKYGVTNNLRIDDVVKKATFNSHTKEAIYKQQQTRLEKYGYITPFQNEESMSLAIKRSHTSKAEKKRKNTFYKKYGENRKEIVEKYKNTMLAKYGVENAGQLKKTIDSHTKESILKGIETKRKNHTFNTSKPEEELYLYIKSKFPNVKRQYKDKERYPYYCDFYIPELDYFIELQGYYTHGKEPYNPASIKHQALVQRYRERYGSDCQAITIWTIKDVEKRNCAKEHNLNFREVWCLEEGKKFVDELFEKSIS